MKFLQELLKTTLDRVKNELLLFAIVIIIFILLYPNSRFEIAIVGFIFAIIYAVIKIRTTGAIAANPDFITQKDWPTVKGRIQQNLAADNVKLDALIPLMGDRSQDSPVDKENQIDSSLTPLQDRLHHLHISARSKIDNEDEINLIQAWFRERHSLNRQTATIRRADYIEENEPRIRDALTKLIEFYGN